MNRGITEDDHPYFIMEYIQGIDLNTAMKIREVPNTEKFDIIIHVLKALSCAHKNNVIHRDIKPNNILIDDDGNVKILDFGIAQFYEGEKTLRPHIYQRSHGHIQLHVSRATRVVR